MATPKRPAFPLMLLANDLLDGDVVFRADGGWSRDPVDAVIARDEETAARLEAEAQASFRAREVVDAYLVDVTIGPNGVPTPNHFRERFKTLGPSHRPDLGKQAEFARS